MKFVLKKIAGLIIALLIVSVLAFLAFEVIPGDPAQVDSGYGSYGEQSPGSAGGDGTEPSPAAALWTVGEGFCHRGYGNLLFLPGSGQRNDWG